MKTFKTLGLSGPILSAVARKGYESPSPIQASAIPPMLEGADVVASAQTGTGKTAAFTLPILERLSRGKPAKSNQVRALILTPTRELAAQVADSVATYGRKLPLRSVVVYGGVKINPQMMKLRKGADILIATPGRLLDLAQQNAVKFDQLEILVLDEADRMLDMGFIRDIQRIIKLLPERRQTVLFSATFSKEIKKLVDRIVRNPVTVSVAPENVTADQITQRLYPVSQRQKSGLLRKLLYASDWNQVLVFTRTKHGANKLAAFLEKEGIPTAAIHGNKSQGARTRALREFKNHEISVLVATDIAARGLDINQLPQVVNYDLPNVPEDYVHRIGRTGRAGASGLAVSLVCADEFAQLRAIENLTGHIIEREVVEGFEPGVPLPESIEGEVFRAPKKKRPASKRKPAKSQRGSNGADSKPRKPRKKKAGGKSASASKAEHTGKPGRSGKPKPGKKPAGKKSAGNKSKKHRAAGHRMAASA